MPYVRDARVTLERLNGLGKKAKELSEDLEKAKQQVQNREFEVGELLVRVTLSNQEDDHKNLDVSRKLLAKAKEDVDDIHLTLKDVANERQKLTSEYYEATVRGTPDEMAKIADDFNNNLDDGLALLAQMEKIHQKLLTLEAGFLNLQKDRADALSRLGRTDTLMLTENLGRLATVGPPYRYIFRVGEEMTDFVSNLKGLQRKLQGYEDFRRTNPD